MSEVKVRCPLPRAGLDSMFLVSVALVQSMARPRDFIMEIQTHLVTEGTPAQPALQVGQAGALGQNNATVSSLDKESQSYKQEGVWPPRMCDLQSTGKAPPKGDGAHPAKRL